MFLVLVSLAFASTTLNIPTDPKPTCELGNYVQPIILIGEVHGSENSKKVFGYIQQNLEPKGKIHFLQEGSSLKSDNLIDNPILRFYALTHALISGYHDGDPRVAAISWVNILDETIRMPELLNAPDLSEAEMKALETLEMFRADLTPNNGFDVASDIQYYMKEAGPALESLAVKLLVQGGRNLKSGNRSLVEFQDPSITIDDIGYWDLRSSFIGLDKARELYMAQRIFDYLCKTLDRKKPVVVQLGDAHISSVQQELVRAMPSIQVDTYSIGFWTYHIMEVLEKINE